MLEGNTFLFPGAADDHLWMIISNPVVDADNIVIVRFLSFRDYYDQSCIVEAGEHPFVKHRTLVDFPAAKLVPLRKLQALKTDGRLKLRADLSPELLNRIRETVPKSGIPLECEKAMEDQGLI